MELKADIGIIARPDKQLQDFGFELVNLGTKFGKMDRLFLGEVAGKKVAVVYGRFDEKRTTSASINFEKTQEAFNLLGVKIIFGAFVTGSIQDRHKIGSVFIPNDFVGIGNYNQSLYRNNNFKNVDMFKPFCKEARTSLIASAKKSNIDFKEGVYTSFHGWPRIETEAELNFYKGNGWDIVGQTLDPEATLAKESGCCYAPIAVTIDDAETRRKFMEGDLGARRAIQNAIPAGREVINKIIFQAVSDMPLSQFDCNCCHKLHSEKSHFRHLPDYMLGE